MDSDQSCIANLPCKKSFSNSIMLAFGGGLCSLSTSSCVYEMLGVLSRRCYFHKSFLTAASRDCMFSLAVEGSHYCVYCE